MNNPRSPVNFTEFPRFPTIINSADDPDPILPIGQVAQALTDTDSDGMDDAWEVTYFGNLSATGSADADSDGMTNGEEHQYGFIPTSNDAFADADGDRYPNVFEVRKSSDPNLASSIPTPNYVVNGAGGGTHTTVGAAVTAANVANGPYQIIGIAPGVYTGSANLRTGGTITSTKPKLLLIGLQGASKTIIDGGGTTLGWLIQNDAVVSSLTFRRTTGALEVAFPASNVRLVDLMVRDNSTTSSVPTPGLYVNASATTKVHVVGSTFLDNTSSQTIKQIQIVQGTGTLLNTVVWSQTSGTMVGKGSSATLVTNNCLVKGQTLTGTGNLAGSTDPKLRADGHLLWDSPLRSAGGAVAQSRVDMDGELRPTTPDIGVDQFNDTDSDELADQWELEYTGNLTTLTSRSQEGDGDGLSNEGEYANATNPIVADTDGDAVSDGDEVLVHATNPLSTDTDRDDMPDGWEVSNGLSPLVANTFEDADGDRYPDVFEYRYSTDPMARASIPTPTYVVNGAGGGTHTTVGAAVTAANVANGPYQIIGIAPGVYTGSANLRTGGTITSTKPKLLLIGLQGAAKTIVDGGGTNLGWLIQNDAVVSSLTFRNSKGALEVDFPASNVRLVDLMVRDNSTTSTVPTPGLYVNASATTKVYVLGSTFLDNTSSQTIKQIQIVQGTGTLLNTVVWSQTSGTMVGKGSSATLVTNNCLVKGQTLTGTGNLSGSTDPKLRADGHLLWDSPLRSAGGTLAQSRIDMDGELRPTTPDIGVDQFNDTDSDELADQWELEYTGNLTTLTSRSQEGDGDGLSNEGEYANATNPIVADTDGDAVSDGDEVLVHATNPLSTDTDRDDMPDGWEVSNGLSPLVANTFEDADGDRYPDVFEYRYSTDPMARASIPTPTYVVNGAGGGTHTTVGAAVTAANVANGPYQIIGIAPGVYTGSANLRTGGTITSTKPKLLLIGLQGAAKTIFDGGGTNLGWLIENDAVISSLTFRNSKGALEVDYPAAQVRFVDLMVRDNLNPATIPTPGLYVNASDETKIHVVGSTFLNNRYSLPNQSDRIMQIQVRGVATLSNTVVWSQTSGTMVGKDSGSTLITNNCLVKGQTLTGTGNLAGNVDPKLLPDGHLLRISPLRGAGAAATQSRIDMDGELRPSTSPDIGVDQFEDPDGDGLPDAWEITQFGNTSSFVGTADDDSDQLSNAEEFDWGAAWLDPDTDSDGVIDGLEVAIGINPTLADADDLAGDINQDGLIDSLGAQLGYQPNQLDSDGDSISNEDEAALGTDPLLADSDDDGVPDGTDPFPLDHLVSALPADPLDVQPPVITLTAPSYAIEQ